MGTKGSSESRKGENNYALAFNVYGSGMANDKVWHMYDGGIKTIIFTGRPMRIKKNEYVIDWEENRKQDEFSIFFKIIEEYRKTQKLWDFKN